MTTEFSEFNLPPKLLARIPFGTATPIQAEAIPYALAGRDVLATSKTGSGKTLAYGLPLISKLLANPQVSAVVLTPTRELAIQVVRELQKLIPHREVRTALLIGGQSQFPQYQQLVEGGRLLVGTPGRINDFLTSGRLLLDLTTNLVLDEADRMLDMGFAPQVKSIIAQMHSNHQTLMFSATLSREVEDIAREFLINPQRINIDPSNQAPAEIIQSVIRVPTAKDKLASLSQTLQGISGKALVFVNTKWGTEELTHIIRRANHFAHYLHGDLPQRKRDQVMSEFRDRTSSILVATDVAARGLHIPHVQCVVNYEIPFDLENYVHRIGRTGRAGEPGQAISIITDRDVPRWNTLCKLMNTNLRQPFQPRANPFHRPGWQP